MQDLIVAALQTDSTRSLTYRMPGQSLLQSLDLKPSAHNVSHYSPGERMEASKIRDKDHSELLAPSDRQTQDNGRSRWIEPLRPHRRGLGVEHQLHPLPDQLPDGSNRWRSQPENQRAPRPAEGHTAVQCVADDAARDGHQRGKTQRQHRRREATAVA